MEESSEDDFELIDKQGKAERRKAIKAVSVKLGELLKAHRKGEPVLDRMAERIRAREREATDSLLRDALKNPEKG